MNKTRVHGDLPYSTHRQLRAQKGVNNIQRCPVENQKGAIVVEKSMAKEPLLVLNGTSLNSDSALLVLS